MEYRENERDYIGFKSMKIASKRIDKADIDYLFCWGYTWAFILRKEIGIIEKPDNRMALTDFTIDHPETARQIEEKLHNILCHIENKSTYEDDDRFVNLLAYCKPLEKNQEPIIDFKFDKKVAQLVSNAIEVTQEIHAIDLDEPEEYIHKFEWQSELTDQGNEAKPDALLVSLDPSSKEKRDFSHINVFSPRGELIDVFKKETFYLLAEELSKYYNCQKFVEKRDEEQGKIYMVNKTEHETSIKTLAVKRVEKVTVYYVDMNINGKETEVRMVEDGTIDFSVRVFIDHQKAVEKLKELL